MRYRVRVESIEVAGEYPNDRIRPETVYEQYVDDLDVKGLIAEVNKLHVMPSAAETAAGLKAGQ